MDVLDYEGRYKISNLGIVKRLSRKSYDGKTLKEKYFKQIIHQSGYVRIPLTKDNKKKYFYVHNLVCIAFMGAKPKGFDVDHIDKNRKNNKLENLRYLPIKENRGIIGNTNAKRKTRCRIKKQ